MQVPTLEPQAVTPDRPELKPLNVVARDLSTGTDLRPGVVDLRPDAAPDSQGSGTLDGADRGRGTGAGPGDGPGLDEGRGGNFGRGARQPGNGVTPPRLLYQVRPAFTTEAMRAHVSGMAVLECVVNADGSVGEVQIVRSIDSRFGLDQQAIEAVRQWRFKAGTLLGEPVAVLVRVELSFALR